MARLTPDFVQVQLTAAGLKLAGGSPLKVNNGFRSLTFTPGQTTKTEISFEWRAWLSTIAHNGEALFEIAPDSSTSATNASSATTTASTK